MSQDLSSLDLCSLYASQQSADVVAGLCLVEQLSEHLYAGYDYLSLLFGKSYDLYFFADLKCSSLYSSCRYCSSSCDGEYVLYRHQERLFCISFRLRNVSVYCFHELYDGVCPLACRVFQGHER